MLINHDFGKDFILYVYGGFDVILAMLVQKNSKGLEQPISFFSKGLEDYEKRYSSFEKHVLSIIKSFKKFITKEAIAMSFELQDYREKKIVENY